MNKTAIRFLLTRLGVAILLMVGWLGWKEIKAQGADWLPVKYVRIESALQYISKDRIKEVLRDQVINGFYNVDIQQVQASVQALPWVERGKVKRVWPDTINIAIDEQVPVARWGNSSLLNSKGDIFKPEESKGFIHLPLLLGPTGYEIKMLEILKRLSDSLADQGLLLVEFRINERRAWRIKLQNEIVINVGRNQPLKKLQRFLNTIPLIQKQQIAKIAVVDLRYSNGYALTWKEGEATIDWKKIANKNKTY